MPGAASDFIRRHVGTLIAMASLIVAVVALVPAFRATELAGEATAAANSAELSVVGIDMTSTTRLREESRFSGEVVETRQIDVAAAKIILRNRGEQTAVVRRMTVHISKVWAPMGCDGAGPGSTAVIYDFVLPGDIDQQRFPMAMSKAVDFEVVGQSTDRMAVTIGEEQLGETGWAWITAATAELTMDDGRAIETDPFVLMNSAQSDRTIGLAREDAEDPELTRQTGRLRCIQDNIAMLEQALATRGAHSPSIRELLDRLRQLGYSAEGFAPATGSPAPTVTVPQPPPPAPGRWVAMLGSLPEATTTTEQVRKAVADLSNRLGVGVQSVSSSTYASLTTGYQVLYHDGGFADGHAALDFCRAHGITSENDCAGRYFSTDPADFGYNCHFSDPQGSPHCVRP